MKAVVQRAYGPPERVLALADIAEPLVGDDDVLVRVHATSVHPDVWHVVTGYPYFLRLIGSGLLRPKNRVPGTDMAGSVKAIGKNVTRFAVGDEVFGETVRGHQWKNGGAFAEMAVVDQRSLGLKPRNVTFEEAAAVPTSGLIALKNLGGDIQPGHKVLINGAGGGVGTLAVQIARSYGAEVTAVDIAQKHEMLRSIGADHVIDHTKEDFTDLSERYDFIFDIPGGRSFSKLRGALTKDGSYVLIGHDGFGSTGGRWIGSAIGRFLRLLLLSPFVSQRMGPERLAEGTDHLDVLRTLVEDGNLTPVVARTYPLAEVREAMRYLEHGLAEGRIVITV